MKILEFDSLESTSDTALIEARKGHLLPFGVTASTQTAGRGRCGDSWESPQGNLYISWVLPRASLAVPLTWVPVVVAQSVSCALFESYRLRVTIKWPNDLLFAGRKLGGILCEHTSLSARGVDMDVVVIGLGLNVNVSPKIHSDDYESICLLQVGVRDATLTALRDCVTDCVVRALTSGTPLRGDFDFRLEAGQIFETAHGPAEILRYERDGTLVCRGLLRGEEETLHSAASAGTWIYARGGLQSRQPPPLVVADQGNTATKIAYYDSCEAPEPIAMCTLLNNNLRDAGSQVEEMRAFLSARAGVPGRRVHCASVASDADRAALARSLASAGWQVVPVPKRPLTVNLSSYRWESLGIDRLARLEALPRDGVSRLVVAMGTCLTVDWMSAHRVYEGGWILPGFGMSLRAMYEGTQALPRLSVEDLVRYASPVSSPPAETEVAVVRGILDPLVAFVTTLLAEHRADESQLVLTGGNARVLTSYFPKAQVRHDLTLEGVRRMALGGIISI